MAPGTVHDLASGRRRPTPATTRALLKVRGGTLPRARVDAGGTRLRLRALHVMGHGSARIARALGVREMTIRCLVRGGCPHRQPPPPRRRHRPVRRLVGQARPRTDPCRARRGHRRPAPCHRRQLVRRRRPGRRPRHPRLQARQQLEARHRHRHRPRHSPARPLAEEQPITEEQAPMNTGTPAPPNRTEDGQPWR